MSKTFRAITPNVVINYDDSINLAESNAAMILEDVLFPDFQNIEYPFSIDLEEAHSRLHHAKALLSGDWFFSNFIEGSDTEQRNYLLRNYLRDTLGRLIEHVDGAIKAGHTTFEVF